MRDGGQPGRPVIVVLSAAPGAVEREVGAGIEEEGVPYALERSGNGGAASNLARQAASRSPLGVGVGIGVRGEVWVHHAKLAEPLTELSSGDGVDARTLGHNAARIVVGLPLKPGNRSDQ